MVGCDLVVFGCGGVNCVLMCEYCVLQVDIDVEVVEVWFKVCCMFKKICIFYEWEMLCFWFWLWGSWCYVLFDVIVEDCQVYIEFLCVVFELWMLSCNVGFGELGWVFFRM